MNRNNKLIEAFKLHVGTDNNLKEILEKEYGYTIQDIKTEFKDNSLNISFVPKQTLKEIKIDFVISKNGDEL